MANPPALGQQFQELAQYGQYDPTLSYSRGFKPYGRGRNRGGGYGGRNKYKSFPMGGRGGGYTNPNGRGGGYTASNAPGIAAPHSHGDGGSNRGGNGGRPAFSVVRCWKC